ncbi:tRNA pseudouridine(38-40) synthase TruA [Candidatus Blochmannia vicinus (nom. nud.)]|uniref:tRNA pseudouridine synthase A n=1 Tax=Candidatus Blochmannia vicinus (nom. nud.) TaxID=251540 RepID=A0A9Q8TWB6_9ENTR|nr:tRNA pseudouridine(38-40) synthase TruA [Candidatus Blochmannia vicinus]URJ28437.1 tRNA pseudouridine(38-40) synthase TruA [Candidatus Blochmannia vicinus]
MQKLALGVEYDGSSYCGWQRQKDAPSIQSCIEYAIKKITTEQVTIFCAGRTDSGVHALGQVVHFETYSMRSKSAWTLGINHYLPSKICVRWAKLVNKDFHARFSAISRRYFYVIYNGYIRSALLFRNTWHYKKYLDINKMCDAAHCLLGENDFTSFCAVGCQSSSKQRKLHHIRIVRTGQCIVIDIKANSFMHHMVRNIVGSLVKVGCGEKPITWVLELLSNCDRSLAGSTAPASGLYLVEVKYPSYFSIPSSFREELWRV